MAGPCVVMMMASFPALVPYMILSMTVEVTNVEISPYKTASRLPKTGQPIRIMTRSIAIVTAPRERCGCSALMDIVRKSVPPVAEPLM